jgi:hypothetical protein
MISHNTNTWDNHTHTQIRGECFQNTTASHYAETVDNRKEEWMSVSDPPKLLLQMASNNVVGDSWKETEWDYDIARYVFSTQTVVRLNVMSTVQKIVLLPLWFTSPYFIVPIFISILFFLCNSHPPSVGIATGYELEDGGVGVRVPVEEEFSLLHDVETGSGVHPASYTMETGGAFPGSKVAGEWSWPLISN